MKMLRNGRASSWEDGRSVVKPGEAPIENREPMPLGRVLPDPPGGARFPMCLYAMRRTFYARGDPHGGSGDETNDPPP